MVEEKTLTSKKVNEVRLINDIVFRELAARYPHIVLKFISVFLSRDYQELLSKFNTNANTYLAKGKLENKSTNCDVIFSSKYEVINVEANNLCSTSSDSKNVKAIKNRNYVYISRILSNLIPISENYENYQIIQINIDAFVNTSDVIIETASVKSTNTYQNITNLVKILNINVAKCYSLYYNENIRSKIVRIGTLLYLNFKEKNKKEIREEIIKVSGSLLTKKEKEELVMFVYDVVASGLLTQSQYEARLRDKTLSRIEAENFNAGRQEGVQVGFEQGIEQGIEQTKFETIKKMLKEKVDIAVISNVSGKTLAEIKEIEKTL